MKVLKSLVLFFTLCLLFTSCAVENEESPEKENVTKYYFDGQQVTLESLDQTKDLIYAHVKLNEVQVFDSNEKYEVYLTGLSLDYKPGSEIRAQLEKAVQLNKIGVKIALLAEQKEKNKAVTEEIDYLLTEMQKVKNSSSKSASLVYLYEYINYGGDRKITTGVVPRLRNSWRNRASSFRAFAPGPLTLCGKTYFRGYKRFYPVITNTWEPNLGNRGFDNRLESYF